MLVKLPEYHVIKLVGPESFSFLQGQVTCDVNLLKEKAWIAGAHCNAKGKAWSTFVAFLKDEAVYLVLTKVSAEASLKELNKYAVFAKTDITLDTENWSVFGCDLESDIEDSVQLKLAPNHFLVLTKNDATPETLDVAESNSTWWANEVLSGRANLYDGTIGEFVPQMLNLQALDYISFNKGCYMGQEMVARMRYLGKNKRALYIAEHTNGSLPIELSQGQDVFKEMNGNSRTCGKIIDFAADDDRVVLQLVLNNDTELSQEHYLDAELKLPLRLLPLPYTLDQS